MASGSLAPFVKYTAFDSNGDPASGWHLFTFVAGSTTKQATYTDSGLTSANTNPIVLDSAGRATIYLQSASSYKFVLQEAATDPPTSPEWTQDNIDSTPASAGNVDIPGTAGENLTAGDAVYLSQGDGGRTNGAWYKGDSDVNYSTALANVVGFVVNTVTSGNTGSFRMSGLVTGLSGLTPGTTYYVSSTPGALSSSGGTFPRRMGVATSATALAMSPPDRDAGTTDAGSMSTIAQSFAGIKTFTDPPIYNYGNQSGQTAALTGTANVLSATATTSTTGSENLGSYNFPADTFDADGKGFKLRVWGKFAATANNKNLNIQFGTVPGSNTLLNFTTAANNKTWDILVMVIRSSATNARAVCNATIGGSAVDTSAVAVVGSQYESVFENIAAPTTSFAVDNTTLRLQVTDSTAAGGTTRLGWVVEML